MSNTPATGSRDCSGISLFDMDVLRNLSKWKEIEAKLEEKRLLARPLRVNDHKNGYLELLAQLTEVGYITGDEFEKRFNQMRLINQIDDHYMVVVIEDKETRKIIAASTLILEYKFIHQCAIRGRLEDVVVLDSYRGLHIGELVVKIIVELAREAYNCYKLTLDSKDELVKFYAKNGFEYGSNMLSIRFN